MSNSISTNMLAADLKEAFVNQYNTIPTLEALAQDYADHYAGEYNGEFDPVDHSDGDELHELKSRCHDRAREMVLDDITYHHASFYLIAYPDQVLHRKPHDHLGSETPLQLITCNVYEIVEERAHELIKEMDQNGELENGE